MWNAPPPSRRRAQVERKATSNRRWESTPAWPGREVPTRATPTNSFSTLPTPSTQTVPQNIPSRCAPYKVKQNRLSEHTPLSSKNAGAKSRTRVLVVRQCPLPGIGEARRTLARVVGWACFSTTSRQTHRIILTSLSRVLRPSMALGVMKMYWRFTERRAAVICGLQSASPILLPPPCPVGLNSQACSC